ncbi:ABC transporter ATP-binding protein [Tsukamurella sp. 8F]|uniref:ABC transporter ATP-binding protein n=1 Tax=unclassified Tsukamurella TaxID=2633480 RepID=UPI0023BA0561|nr:MULTISPECIES: ABC transporter ATP-binding protein [unclassified Tsukamurella]MDF0529501.1 ABC transporter ATP-binding protein [Tsukamurella sp. 8J]MDF0585811.1 ABC transporter ATP-binding protein [Tsukamurella sp. 8F]
MSSIELVSATKRFGRATAVDSVDLRIDDGEFVVLLGPSGCGKSTLLRMIAGLATPTSGRILIDGRDVTGSQPRERELAMVFQSYALYPHLSVAKNIGFPLRARRRSRADIAAAVTRVAEMLGLTDYLSRRPADLSGGQRQRVALARAMVQQPGAFLMDEPLSNLDSQLRSATRTELIDLHRRIGTTFLYVTHDQVEAMTMATRIVLLNAGRVEQIGTPTTLYDRPESTFVARFLGAPPMCLFDGVARGHDGRVHVHADRIALPLDLAAPAPDTGEQAVTVGIRPERLRIDPGGPITATVTMIENLGSDEVLHVGCGDTRLQVRTPRPAGVRSGDVIRLDVSPADIHLFDPETGRRLRHRTDPPRRTAPNADGRDHPEMATSAL